MHVHNPFHRVRVWSESGYFMQTSLQQLGMVLRLGHIGSSCSYYRFHPDAELREVVVIHENGLHKINVQYCRCGDQVSFHAGGDNGMAQQLWQVGIFPATWTSPKTGATVAVLRQFRLLTVECKVNASSFITYLRRSGAVIREEEFAVRVQPFTLH